MKAIILGAGAEFAGLQSSHPAALHEISTGKRTLDYLISALSACGIDDIAFVGGPGIEKVISIYPGLRYYYNPAWKETNSLSSLRICQGELGGSTLIGYSDALYSEMVIKKLVESSGDIAVLEDRSWKSRYDGRGQELLDSAEKIATANGLVQQIGRRDDGTNGWTGQFAGMLKLSSEGARSLRGHLQDLNQCDPNDRFHESATLQRAGLTDLIQHLVDGDSSVHSVPIDGHWAELDAPQDIAQFVFGTKAETLERLCSRLTRSVVADQVRFTVCQWRQESSACVARVKERFGSSQLVVRSSAIGEDSWTSSHAGQYESVIGVDGSADSAIKDAVERVVESYEDTNDSHQCLIQPQISDVAMSGVAFTRDPSTAAPYFIINFDRTGRTDVITSGAAEPSHTLVLFKYADDVSIDPALIGVVEALKEVERVVGHDSLDIEFAVTNSGEIHMLQVRPLVIHRRLHYCGDDEVKQEIDSIKQYVTSICEPNSHLLGQTTLLGVMPDWNPAEIIGRNPRPLSLSLYQYLITDEIWGRQRMEFGYRDTFFCPLVLGLAGQGFVDTRASFNSFMPASLPEPLATKLVDHYLSRLKAHPDLHDKVEFEIAYTCLAFDFDQRAERLAESGFNANEIATLKESLRELTNDALIGFDALHDRWQSQIQTLKQRRKRLLADPAGPHQLPRTIRRLLEDCRRFGTLPFSHLARCGFIAVELLRSLIALRCIEKADFDRFLSSIETVASHFTVAHNRVACGTLPLESFLKDFAHLRPGTYDLLSWRYDEKPEMYFDAIGGDHRVPESEHVEFEFSPAQVDQITSLLKSSGLQVDVAAMDSFVRRSIQGREYAKFEFTKNLSEALRLLTQFGEYIGVSREDLTYLPITELLGLASNPVSPSSRANLRAILDASKKRFNVTKAIKLPHLISSPSDIQCFDVTDGQPNFVTLKKVTAPVVRIEDVQSAREIDGRIVHIPNADPGFDWIFARDPAGLLTTFGGANSHMAIRAAEFRLPAAIGCGERLEQQWQTGTMIELNCSARQINIVGHR